MKKVVSVRKLMSLHPDEIATGLKSNICVVFEDGVEVAMTSREAILTRYMLDLLTITPKVPLVSKYVIMNYYNNGMYVSKSINNCFEVMFRDIVELYVHPNHDRTILKYVFKKMFEIVNSIYNNVIQNNLNYSTTLDIKVFLDIQMDKELLDSMKRVHDDKDLASVENSYNVFDKVIRKDIYKNNIIARSYIAGTIKQGQVKQMLAARGFVTEIDSTIFKYPVATSYTLGLTNIYDLAIESRSSAKALFLSTRAIKEAEYFAREMQLVAMTIEQLVSGDCGNTEYINWLVRDASYTGKSDLPNMIGKRYYDEVSKSEKIIYGDEKHLVGTVIKLRSPMKCKLPDKTTVCSSCFGELSNAIHDKASLGHICTTTLTQKVSQGMLSAKHVTFSAISNKLVLDDTAKKFFSVKGKDGYTLRASVLGKARSKLYLSIQQVEGFGIKDLSIDTNVHTLNIGRVSRIKSILLIIEHDNGKVETYPISVNDGNRYGNFTYEMLKHIIATGYVLDENNNYVININDYKSNLPIITLPQVEYNFLELSKAIKAEFKYMDIVKGKYSKESQESLLQKVFDIVSSKLDVNLAVLEVIVCAFSVVSIKDNNYDVGRNSPDVQLGRIKDIMSNRSMGGAYGWETVNQIMLSPSSFNGNNAIDHPLDVLLKPTETLRDYAQ